MERTRYTSAREILRNGTFPRQTAKCEMSSCERGMDLSAENRCNEEKPSITSNGAMLGFFLLRFGAFFEDKTVYVLFVFLCRIDILRSTHHGKTVRPRNKK